MTLTYALLHVHPPNTVTHSKTSYMTGRGSGSVLACMCNTVGLILDTAENNKVKKKKKKPVFSLVEKRVV